MMGQKSNAQAKIMPVGAWSVAVRGVTVQETSGAHIASMVVRTAEVTILDFVVRSDRGSGLRRGENLVAVRRGDELWVKSA